MQTEMTQPLRYIDSLDPDQPNRTLRDNEPNLKHNLYRSHLRYNRKNVLGNALLVLGVKPNRGWHVFLLFFKLGLRSATSFKRSRQERFIDVAEHMSMLKNYQNTHHSRFSLTKTGIAFPKIGVWFLLCT